MMQFSSTSVLSMPGLRARAHSYIGLCKLRIVELIVFTAVVGMLLAVPEWPPFGRVLLATLGIGLAAASAAALNHVIDRHIDNRMRRTCYRPLPWSSSTWSAHSSIEAAARHSPHHRPSAPRIPT